MTATSSHKSATKNDATETVAPLTSKLEQERRECFVFEQTRANFLKENDVTPAMMMVLLSIDQDHIGVREGAAGIARMLEISASACGEVVRVLEKKKFIERRHFYTLASSTNGGVAQETLVDGNVKCIVFTPKGRQALRSYLAMFKRAKEAPAVEGKSK